MTFMRHSDPKLTLKTYGRLGRTVAGKMPALLPVSIPLPSPLTSPRPAGERGLVRKGEEEGRHVARVGGSSEGLEMKVIEENREVPAKGEDSSPGWIRTNDQPINSRLLYR
jgi:hypothetical protein